MKTERAVEPHETLCGIFPMRPIKSDDEHVRAIAQLNNLLRRYPGQEDDPSVSDVYDYTEVLALIIEDHESRIYGEPAPGPADERGE